MILSSYTSENVKRANWGVKRGKIVYQLKHKTNRPERLILGVICFQMLFLIIYYLKALKFDLGICL